MRLTLPLATLAILMTACTPDMVGTADSDYDTPAPNQTTYDIWAERLDNFAQINVELLADWDDPNAHGWHFQESDTDGEVELELTNENIEGALGNNPSFSLENLECIRFNVTWGEGCEEDSDQPQCNWLAYGQGDSAYTTGAYTFYAPGDWDTPGIVNVDGGSSLMSCRN
jgi:hypothetical protein